MKKIASLAMPALVLVIVVVSCACGDEVAPVPPSSPPQALPVIHYFNAAPTNIGTGNYSTLDWSVSNAQQVEISPGLGKVGAVDSMVVSPAATTNYTLTASNGIGSVTATVQVEVATPPAVLPVIHYFTSAPSSIQQSSSVTLSWEVSGADQITISNVVVVVQTQTGMMATRETVEVPSVGTRVDASGLAEWLSIGTTVTYTLTATSSAGTVSKTVDVYINP